MYQILLNCLICFLINLTVKRSIVAFPFNMYFIAFSLYYFFNFKFFLISFSQLFSGKYFNNFFTFKITKNIHSVFYFFNQKNFLRLIRNLAFCKIVLIVSPTLHLGPFSSISLLESIYVLDFTST